MKRDRTTSPANGSTEPPAVGPAFPLQVNITNNLPAAGVTIEVSAAPEAGGAAFFTQTPPDVKNRHQQLHHYQYPWRHTQPGKDHGDFQKLRYQ